MLLSKKHLTFQWTFFLCTDSFLSIMNMWTQSARKLLLLSIQWRRKRYVRLQRVRRYWSILIHVYSFNLFFIFLLKDTFLSNIFMSFTYDYTFTFLHPRPGYIYSPSSAAMHFLVNKFQEFGVKLRWQLLPDKFAYSHYLFAG